MGILLASLVACNSTHTAGIANPAAGSGGKVIIYQVFTRLFGNKDTTNKPWGTIEENGVGKFADFTGTALDSIKALGATHIWYTGVPHHAVIRDYTAYGISNDDPDVVKGRAGSPYAVKDYYNVNPDLATNPAERLEEFKALIDRTHAHGLKVIIDIVPNHVARQYVTLATKDGVQGFGATDDTTVEYNRDNNFYYIPGENFKVPNAQGGYQPLGGEAHTLSDGKFEERPAKWTGNGSRLAQPDFNDWYETVKINYGIRPDGSKDFDTLPADFAQRTVAEHYAFWQGKDVPSSWKKFRDIALFWIGQGVDGFRFDMSEMVPVEFWSYMNSAIKTTKPSALLLAEIYNPAQYRNYILKGKMDYLYDKVDTYDRMRELIVGGGSTDSLAAIQARYVDIEQHLLHFLENHDEQRLASPEFAGDPAKAKPAMVVSATMGSAPVLIYFGQEVGEPGAQDAGFGRPSRTSIFDYIGVPAHQRWMNAGAFDGGKLSAAEKSLRGFYQRLLRFTRGSAALSGQFADLHRYNRQQNAGYTDRLYAFARWSEKQELVILSNFSSETGFSGSLYIPASLIQAWGLKEGNYPLKNELEGSGGFTLQVTNGTGKISVSLQPLESLILSLP